jgi:hypothetical protein
MKRTKLVGMATVIFLFGGASLAMGQVTKERHEQGSGGRAETGIQSHTDRMQTLPGDPETRTEEQLRDMKEGQPTNSRGTEERASGSEKVKKRDQKRKESSHQSSGKSR